MARGCWCLWFIVAAVVPAAAQIDQARAEQYFKEAQALCERDGGRLWGVSLCGPMVFADAATGTIATSQPAPAGDRPRPLGFVNAPLQWGGITWSAYAWHMLPTDQGERGRLFMHELFHAVQPSLGLMAIRDPSAGENIHLDSLEGRYWMRLEWRALARALGASGAARTSATADALAFRGARHQRFPAAAASEHVVDINEGVATYTQYVTGSDGAQDAIRNAMATLAAAETGASFVRTFAYASGAGYGLLLDALSPAAPPLQLMLARDRTCNGDVLLGVDHADGPTRCGVLGAPTLVVSLFARREILGVTDVQRIVGTTQDVRERHPTTMPSSSAAWQDGDQPFDALRTFDW